MGDFDIVSYHFGDNVADPDESLNAYYVTGGGRNYGSLSDKEIDQLIAKQARTIDAKERQAIVADIEKRLLDLMPLAVIFWDKYQTGSWKEVRNYKPGPGVHPWAKLDYVWLAK